MRSDPRPKYRSRSNLSLATPHYPGLRIREPSCPVPGHRLRRPVAGGRSAADGKRCSDARRADPDNSSVHRRDARRGAGQPRECGAVRGIGRSCGQTRGLRAPLQRLMRQAVRRQGTADQRESGWIFHRTLPSARQSSRRPSGCDRPGGAGRSLRACGRFRRSRINHAVISAGSVDNWRRHAEEGDALGGVRSTGEVGAPKWRLVDGRSDRPRARFDLNTTGRASPRRKALCPSGCESRPATVAPAGSSRSGAGRSALKHSGRRIACGRFSEHAGRNAKLSRPRNGQCGSHRR